MTSCYLGIESISVVLMFLKADVIYDSKITTAADIAAAIEDLGFDTQVLEDSASNNEKVNLLVNFRFWQQFNLVIEPQNGIKLYLRLTNVVLI